MEDMMINAEEMEIEREEESVNLIDLLLDKEKEDFLVRSEEIEITSLSRLLGAKAIVEMRRMSLAKEAELEDYGYKIKITGKGNPEMKENNKKKKLLTLVYSIYYKGEELFKNRSLMAKFGAGTPEDLVLIMLTPDEIDTLYMAYDELVNNIPNEVDIKNY